MAHVIRGERSLPAEILAVLGNQHKAWIGSVIDRFRPGVADPVGKIVREPFVHIDQQSVVLRIPAGCGLKVDGDRKGANSGREWTRSSVRTIKVFYGRATLRVVKDAEWRSSGSSTHSRIARVRLVDIEKAPQMR